MPHGLDVSSLLLLSWPQEHEPVMQQLPLGRRRAGDKSPLPTPAPSAQAQDSLSPHGDELVDRDGARALSPGTAEQRPLPVERAATGLQSRGAQRAVSTSWTPTAAATTVRSHGDASVNLAIERHLDLQTHQPCTDELSVTAKHKACVHSRAPGRARGACPSCPIG